MSSAALRRADEQVRSQFGIEPIQLMEVAGWQVARFVDGFVDGVRGKRVTVVAGSGNNGGDALVAARFLQQRGAIVRASIVPTRDHNSLAARHGLTLDRLGISRLSAPKGVDPSADLLVDGLFGIGIRLPLRDPAPGIIAAMNASQVPIVAIDVPSGLDADNGAGQDGAVRAAATITLVAPKTALRGNPNAGRVFVADIGIPIAVFSTEREALAGLYQIGDMVELTN
ncbi:MAG: ADP-dependent NAD(P)H-hydrate dehydratase / NAD(P)H-hydrate epimerase [Chloroflexota bacterium]|jgi:NAD(P)H-hydrate epimerase|nr:ADP-dependent NAD(P)H-hydrate dehydratase / NAD(P)H-hydrate epimerase [Chloroflexota bacterium]MEA2669741.1 ADP-dependent NAD(P)H-hydrate dehydratase / NAD(P)H-hydrate epimerase [Chloroflexota bacterium]